MLPTPPHCCPQPPSRHWLRRFALGIPLLVALATSSASAQSDIAPERPSNIDVARSIAISGREAYGARDFETAVALFQRAYALFQAPTLVLYEARALREMGNVVEASAAFERAARLTLAADAPPQFSRAIETARIEGQQLTGKIPTLTIKISGAEPQDARLSITRNGNRVSPLVIGQAQTLNPGQYRIEASLGAGRSDTVDERIELEEHRTVVLNLAASTSHNSPPALRTGSLPGDHSSGRNTLTVLSAGIGVAGIGAGLVTGMLASDQHKDASTLCESGCASDSDGADAVAKFRSLRTASTVAYSVGAVGTISSLALWLVSRRGNSSTASLKPWIGRSSAGIRGQF